MSGAVGLSGQGGEPGLTVGAAASSNPPFRAISGRLSGYGLLFRIKQEQEKIILHKE